MREECEERWKKKHPCESEWYAKALRHLLVQFKESLSLVISEFLHKLHNSPSEHKEEAAFIFSPKRYAQALKAGGFSSPMICWQLKPLERKSWPVWLSQLMTSLSVLLCVSACVYSLRRLQTGWCCPSSFAHTGWPWSKQKPPPWGERVLNHALSCCCWSKGNPMLATQFWLSGFFSYLSKSFLICIEE